MWQRDVDGKIVAYHKMEALGEGPATYVAWVRLFAGVRHDVALEAPLVRKWLATHVARQVTLTQVHNLHNGKENNVNVGGVYILRYLALKQILNTYKYTYT